MRRALPFGDAGGYVRAWLAVLPYHLHRLPLEWERATLPTSAEYLRSAAEEDVRAIEDYVRNRHLGAIALPPIRALMLNAYAAARAGADAQRHWQWLLAHKKPLSAATVHSGLAAARDAAELEDAWAAAGQCKHDVSPAVLELHRARVGHMDGLVAHWAACARTGAVPEAPTRTPSRASARASMRSRAPGWTGTARCTCSAILRGCLHCWNARCWRSRPSPKRCSGRAGRPYDHQTLPLDCGATIRNSSAGRVIPTPPEPPAKRDRQALQDARAWHVSRYADVAARYGGGRVRCGRRPDDEDRYEVDRGPSARFLRVSCA